MAAFRSSHIAGIDAGLSNARFCFQETDAGFLENKEDTFCINVALVLTSVDVCLSKIAKISCLIVNLIVVTVISYKRLKEKVRLDNIRLG